MSETLDIPLTELPAKLLQDAFERFNDASTKLEVRHEELQREVRDLREKLHCKEEEIKQSARLAMLGETAAAIAHEVRNPLGAIKIFVSLLREDVRNNPASLKLVDQIDKSVSSLNHIVSNILQLASNKELALHPVNLHTIIKEQVLQIQGVSQCKVAIELSLQGSPYILGDECGLRQVLYNLLNNSVQSTHNNGLIQITCIGNSDSTRLLIRDNGDGIPLDILPRLFDPFVTGRKEGTGLGLAIVKRIVEQHNGTIAVRNDGGAEFSISFPKRN